MTRPFPLYLWRALALGSLTLSACTRSTSETEPLTLATLQGHWKATSLLYLNLADNSQSLEMVATGDQSIDLTTTDSTYLRVDTFFATRFAVIQDSGRLELNEPVLQWVSASDDTVTVGVTIANERLTLTDTTTIRLLCASSACPTLIRTRFRRAGG